MASPVLPFQTYRITKVPAEVSTESVRQWFVEAERSTILHISRALPAGNRDLPEYVFTITFSKQPDSLVDITPMSGPARALEYLSGPGPQLATPVIDADFRGLTLFNNITDEDAAVDIVGVTGLAGRSFGSWQCSDGSMWLRDHLPKDISNVSVSVFGYSSKLVNSDSHATLRNFSDDFLDRLATSREFRPERRRPLILIGHSLGGMIIKDAWVRCAEEDAIQSHRDLRRAIYGMVFFGTPHDGMRVEEMIICAQGQPGEVLARDLQPGSPTVKLLKERFARASRELKVVSCYETRETPTPRLDNTGRHSRTGPEKLMVPESSACLFWPDGVETRIHIDANHSMIAKLSNGTESKYDDIRRSIAGIANDAVMQVRCRFLLPEVYEALKRTCYLLKFIQRRATKLQSPCHEFLLGISTRAEAIHSTLTHQNLGAAILGVQSGRQVVTSFAEKTFQLLGIFSPYEAVARERDPEYQVLTSKEDPSTVNRNRSAYQISEKRVGALFSPDSIAAILNQARDIMQAQVQTLSISMLREPVDQDMLESHSPTKKAGLHKIATMQAMLSTDSEEFQSPLQGSLSVSSSDSRHGVDSLITGCYSEGNGRPTQLVLVEYKTYALPKNQYIRGMSDDEKQQAAVTKDLAQKLALLLRKSSLETGDADQALHEFDATMSTFRCLGYKDDIENSRLAFLYEIPEAGVMRGPALSPEVKTLMQLIGGGLKVPLEYKFQLAFKICSTVLNLHCSGWVHKSIRSDNVVLIPKVERGSEASDGTISNYDVYLKGFEFSRKAVGKSNPFESSSDDDLYRHPDRQGLPDKRFTKEYDLYAVGLVLLEIGTGRSLLHLLKVVQQYLHKNGRSENPQEYREGFRQLADVNIRSTMGTKYAHAVVKCLDGAADGFGVHRDDSKYETDLALAFQQQVVWEIAPGMDL